MRVRIARWALYPLATGLVYVLLVGLGWSGTSSGVLHSALTGGARDTRSLAGTARSVRSDEWLVATPYAISQSQHGFARVNPDLGTGQDISLPFNLPYWDWTVLFRPETVPALVLPLGHGFAGWWWAWAWILAVGAYAFSLALLPGRYVFAAGVSLALLFSPFVQWWYEPSTLLSLGWACWAGAAAIAVSRARSKRAAVWAGTALAYAVTAMAMSAYVPFVLPCLLVVIAVALGSVFSPSPSDTAIGARPWRLRLAVMAGAAAASILFLAAFVLTRTAAIRGITGTVYPGARRVPTGQINLATWLSGPFDWAYLPRATSLRGWAANASEGSSFVLMGLFLLPVAAWQIVRGVRARRLNAMLVATTGVLVLFILVAAVPHLSWIAQVTGLSLVPTERLTIGLGLASTVLAVAVVADWVSTTAHSHRGRTACAGAVGLLALVATLVTGIHLRHVAPHALRSGTALLATAIVVSAIAVLLLVRATAAVLLWATMCCVLGAPVNPLYQGLYNVGQTPLGRTVAAVDRGRPGNWVSVGDIYSTAILPESGVSHLSGVYGYPSAAVWQWFDPKRVHRQAWDRYAYVLFRLGADGSHITIGSPQADVVISTISACDPVVQAHVTYVLAGGPLTSACLRLKATAQEGRRTYYIYATGPK
ncbi:hypothetical protein M6D93_11960 [Jatrophihabitans telluris]|uniref:YfhO family protein n=1 Tax=Jatrophihabitans telluris TaxID=2038343 RepID=A0ABY4QVF6_9ACTN|nr:hypothetical protein [Jatrophihabitans telluris]UQX87021.1 hypothetical protein M6D93_11960 [Jatrophihabitans telluris]